MSAYQIPGVPGPSSPPQGAGRSYTHIPGLFRSGGQTTNYGGNLQVDVNQAQPGWAVQPAPGSPGNPGGLDSNVGPGTLGSLGQAHQLLIQQGTGGAAAGGLPPIQHLANPLAQAVHVAPFQAAIQNALKEQQAKSQMAPGLGLHPQVDRMHAVHAGSSIAQQLVKHFAGTLARNQGRGV